MRGVSSGDWADKEQVGLDTLNPVVFRFLRASSSVASIRPSPNAWLDTGDVTFTPGCGFKIADPFLNLQFGFIRVMRCVPHDLESSNFVMPCVA
jgi:hypothetical protein